MSVKITRVEGQDYCISLSRAIGEISSEPVILVLIYENDILRLYLIYFRIHILVPCNYWSVVFFMKKVWTNFLLHEYARDIPVGIHSANASYPG
jgi:hypothetical protein